MEKPEVLKCSLAACFGLKTAPALTGMSAWVIAACGGIAAAAA